MAKLQQSVKDLCRGAAAPRLPFQGKSMPSVSLYRTGVLETLHTFLPTLQAREKPPTPEQTRAVAAVINRLQIEYEEQQTGSEEKPQNQQPGTSDVLTDRSAYMEASMS